MRLQSRARLALVRPDRIGDCVLASCAVRDVPAAHPFTDVFWVVRDDVAPLFSGPGFPATVVSYNALETADVVADRWRGLRLDAIVHLNPDPLAESAARLAGVPVRVGLKSAGEPGALTLALPLNKDAGRLHEAMCGRRLINLLRDFAVDESAPLEPCVAPDAAALAEAVAAAPGLLDAGGRAAARYAVLHPGAHGGKTRLPHALFRAVAESVAARHGCRVVLVGGAVTADDLPQGLIPGAVDLRGATSLAATAHLLRAAALVVSRDSGPAHLAAALGAPTVCVFPDRSPWADPARWMPLGPRVATVVTPATPRWYEKINYDWYRARAAAAVDAGEVLRAAERLLVAGEAG